MLGICFLWIALPMLCYESFQVLRRSGSGLVVCVAVTLWTGSGVVGWSGPCGRIRLQVMDPQDVPVVGELVVLVT